MVANRIVLSDVIVQLLRQQAGLATVPTFDVVGMGLGASREEVAIWLREEGLYEALTPMEKGFVASETPTKRELINASWQSDALLVLLWALEKVEDFPPGNVPNVIRHSLRD